MTDNRKYVKRGQALIIRNDPQRYEEVTGANRNKVGAPFQYAESLFAAPAAVKSMTRLPYRHLQGSEDAVTCQCAKHENVASRIVPFKLEYAKRRNAAARIAPFKLKCAEHMFPKGSIHHLYYNEDAFTCIQDRNNICTNLFGGHHSNPSGENFDSRSHA